jgi:hypothetical protein
MMRHTGCTSANALSVVSVLKETMDKTDRELETSLGRARLALGFTCRLGFSARLSRHCWIIEV